MLTAEEIAEADCIIIAADKNVEMARFDGKPVIMTGVSDGIYKAEELIDKAVSGTVPIYRHSGGSAPSDSGAKGGIGHTAYKHLMNGVSICSLVIGGGILIALAFLP